MLFFVGLGLYDEQDISVKGLEIVRSADAVYAEFYTSRLMGTSIEKLERLYGRRMKILSRSEIEGEPEWIEEARERNVALLVGGDPMISTTHLDLRLRAIEMGIDTRVIHASNIASAVPGITGLQNYRFGRSATVPFPHTVRGKRIVSSAPYDAVKDNLSRDLHTLLYLDIQDERFMSINEAADLLIEVAEGRDDAGFASRLAVGIARAGSEDMCVRAGALSDLRICSFGPPLHVLVIPGRLHFMEAKALRILAGATEELLSGYEL
ncbi:MAG: diphthine synthase [Methanothrix sp.]|jgi:diphthine synthase|uniref:diphthine synthase n=1 Tax=Methanothrix sp. TaxID=90426 RepID=UPI00247EDA8B|nr:diphthine synthase [Methanothrix sp.]